MKDRERIEAFTKAYLSYRPVLEPLVRRVLRGTTIEVEDVLQDVWVNGAIGWPKLRDQSSYRSWLGRIAINAAIGARRRHRVPARFAAENEEVEDPGPRSDDHVLRRQLRAAIDELDDAIPGQIAALRLVHLEGRTYAEAADRLGLAEGTVKSQTFKAVARLRSRLAA